VCLCGDADSCTCQVRNATIFIQKEVLYPVRRLHDRTLAALSMRKQHHHFVVSIYQLQFMQSAVLGVVVLVKGQLYR
jgi:hypothetical protein